MKPPWCSESVISQPGRLLYHCYIGRLERLLGPQRTPSPNATPRACRAACRRRGALGDAAHLDVVVVDGDRAGPDAQVEVALPPGRRGDQEHHRSLHPDIATDLCSSPHTRGNAARCSPRRCVPAAARGRRMRAAEWGGGQRPGLRARLSRLRRRLGRATERTRSQSRPPLSAAPARSARPHAARAAHAARAGRRCEGGGGFLRGPERDGAEDLRGGEGAAVGGE